MVKEDEPTYDAKRAEDPAPTLAIIGDVANERAYQVKRYGNDFDDKNTVNDWNSYICYYAASAALADCKSQQRIKLIKAATLAVAAVEAFDRNDGFPDRHYDKDLKHYDEVEPGPNGGRG